MSITGGMDRSNVLDSNHGVPRSKSRSLDVHVLTRMGLKHSVERDSKDYDISTSTIYVPLSELVLSVVVFTPDTECPVTLHSREPIHLSKQNKMFMKYLVQVEKHCSFLCFIFRWVIAGVENCY